MERGHQARAPGRPLVKESHRLTARAQTSSTPRLYVSSAASTLPEYPVPRDKTLSAVHACHQPSQPLYQASQTAYRSTSRLMSLPLRFTGGVMCVCASARADSAEKEDRHRSTGPIEYNWRQLLHFQREPQLTRGRTRRAGAMRLGRRARACAIRQEGWMAPLPLADSFVAAS